MVRLKVGLGEYISAVVTSFNSLMVRLKAIQKQAAPVLKTCFNSLMVRLKDLKPMDLITSFFSFQFLDGAIKSLYVL